MNRPIRAGIIAGVVCEPPPFYRLRNGDCQSIRLNGYDYSAAGAYFVTLCVKDRWHALGRIHDGEMILSPAGRLIANAWQWLESHHDAVTLDEWVIMPDHLHGIIILQREESRVAPGSEDHTVPGQTPKTLGRLIGAFKTVTTKRINQVRRTPGGTFWQRNYWERVVRNEAECERIRHYIRRNPAMWQEYGGGS